MTDIEITQEAAATGYSPKERAQIIYDKAKAYHRHVTLCSSLKQSAGFGERLRNAREARDINQTELAAKAGLQPSAIGHFEKERRKPSFSNIRALAEALDVTSDFLLGRTDKMEGATTVFRGEENLTSDDRDRIQMMIDLMNQRKSEK